MKDDGKKNNDAVAARAELVWLWVLIVAGLSAGAVIAALAGAAVTSILHLQG